MRFILPALTTIAFGLVAALPSNSPPVKESLHEERRLTPPKLYHNPNTKHSNLPTASLTVNTSHRADDEAFNFEMHDSDEEQKPDGELPCTTLSQQNSVIELKSFADYSHPWAIPGNNDLHVAVLKAENDRVDVLKKEIARLLNKEKDAHANQPESHSEILLLVKEKYFAAQNELDLTPLSLAIVRNYFDVMWYLLEQYPKALYILDKYGRTSLHLAAKFGNERMVVSLARISPRSLFVKDVFGKTPVMVAEAEEQKNGISFEEENGNARALRIELSRFYLAAIDSPTDTFNSANSFDFVSSSGSDEPQQQQQKQHDQLTMEDVVAVVGDTSEIVKPKKSVTFSVKHNVREIRRVVDIAEDHKRRKQLRNKCTIL